LAGSVYFISVPGLTDNHAPGSIQHSEAQHAQQGQQQQQNSATETAGRRSLEGYNTSVQQQQQQPYQTQPQPQSQPSETELAYATATTHQQHDQPSQLNESQLTQSSQYQPPKAQDQILPQPLPQQRSQPQHEYDYAQNPYLQQHQQPSVADVGFKPSSQPTRSSSYGLGRGGSRLSPDNLGGIQTGITATAASGGPIQPAVTATPSWVLPKKTPPATVAGGSPIAGQNGGGGGLPGSFRRISASGGAGGSPILSQRDNGSNGLPGQFGRISLSDPEGVDGLSRSPANQGA
jgi:hypothetical protein